MQTCNTQHLHVGSAHMLMLMQCHLAQQDVGAFHSLLGLFTSLLLLLLWTAWLCPNSQLQWWPPWLHHSHSRHSACLVKTHIGALNARNNCIPTFFVLKQDTGTDEDIYFLVCVCDTSLQSQHRRHWQLRPRPRPRGQQRKRQIIYKLPSANCYANILPSLSAGHPHDDSWFSMILLVWPGYWFLYMWFCCLVLVLPVPWSTLSFHPPSG